MATPLDELLELDELELDELEELEELAELEELLELDELELDEVEVDPPQAVSSAPKSPAPTQCNRGEDPSLARIFMKVSLELFEMKGRLPDSNQWCGMPSTIPVSSIAI